MDTTEKKIFELISEAFKENGIQVIKVDQPTSKIYKLKSKKIESLESIQQEIKSFIDATEPADVVFIYDVLTAQIKKEPNDEIENVYFVRLDLQ